MNLDKKFKVIFSIKIKKKAKTEKPGMTCEQTVEIT